MLFQQASGGGAADTKDTADGGRSGGAASSMVAETGEGKLNLNQCWQQLIWLRFGLNLNQKSKFQGKLNRTSNYQN